MVERRKTLLPVVLAVLGGLGMVGIAFLLRGQRETREEEAYRMAQALLPKYMEFPHTASYPKTPIRVTYEGDDVYLVVAWVESRNKTGDLVRTRFACWVGYREGAWHLVGLATAAWGLGQETIERIIRERPRKEEASDGG